MFDWLKTLSSIYARMSPEAVCVSAKIGQAELLLFGCTTSSDHFYVYPNGSRTDDEIRVAVELGIRFTATRGSMSRGESKGGLPPDSRRTIEQFHQRQRFGMVHVALAHPGMIGWPLEEDQAQIFGLVDAGEIGVTLGPDTYVMQPLKSLSLVIGLNRELDAAGQSCDFCSMREICRYKERCLE